MEPTRQFLSFLNKFILLSEADFNEIIQPFIEVRHFKKREVITFAGDTENYINLIVGGLVRKYFRKDGEDFVTQISREDQIIHSQESFHSQTPSDYFIEAIEVTTLLSITYANLNTIFATSATMERMGRLVVIYVMVINDRWQMSLLKLSPRERFLSFMQNNAELLQRTPQKYLASLLNIQPETFSRFKHLVRKSPLSPGGKAPAPPVGGT